MRAQLRAVAAAAASRPGRRSRGFPVSSGLLGTGAWPDASNTGVPAGTTLTASGSITTTSAGQVIQDLDISGYINVAHPNVVIRRCRITKTTEPYDFWARIGTDNPSVATNTTVEDCEIDGGNFGQGYGIGVHGTVRRNEVRLVENGINPQGHATLPCLYEDNWVKLLTSASPAVGPHSDSCPMQGGNSNVTVRHNTLDVTDTKGFNAHFFINSYFNATDNVTIDNNLLIGVPANDGFNFYSYRQPFDGVDKWFSLTNIHITNNRIVPAPYGVFAPQQGQNGGLAIQVPPTTWSGNVNHITGEPIEYSGGGQVLSGQRWSNTSTWGGVLPDQATPIVIGAGETRILDMLGAEHGSLDIDGGTLILDPTVNTSLIGPWIRVRNGGKILGGTAGSPLTTNHAITVNGSRASSGVAQKYTIELGQPSDYTIKEAWPSVDTPPTANAEVITVTYTSTTTMTVSSSVAGALPGATAGVRYNNRIHMVPGVGVNGTVYTFTLYQQANRNGGVQRGINVDMADIEIYAATPSVTRTRIDGNLAAGTQTIKLVDDITGWLVGDQIVLGPTDFRGSAGGAVQTLTIASVNTGTRTITTVETVGAARYGLLQYATDAGMSNTAGTLTNNGGDGSGFPAEIFATQPKVVDQRAWVSYVSRRVNFEAPNDSDWTTSGFGVHMMLMGRTSKVKLKGVGMRRCGQRGIFGRYPIHSHLPSFNLPYGGSYPTDGTLLGAVDWQIEDCSIRESEQRGIVIHGCVGLSVRRNSIVGVKAHAIFQEDGSDWDNDIHDNIIMDVNNAADADALVESDKASGSGSSGMWLSNPRNRVTGNVVARSAGVGIWNAWSQPRVLGQSREVTLPDCGWLLLFNNGSIPPIVGSTITQGAASGTVYEVNVNDGFFSSGNAVGMIRLVNVTGTFAAGALTTGGTLTVTNLFGAPAAQQIPTSLIHSPVAAYDRNITIACGKAGGAFDAASILTGRSHENNRGEILDRRFGFPNAAFRLNFEIHKGEHGYLNRVEGPIYDRCVMADVKRRGFRGQAASIALTGIIPAPLMVRESLNNATPVGLNVSGITSYHRLLNSKWGIYIGFTEAPLDITSPDTIVPRAQAGADGGDVYTDPIIDFSLWSGKFINSVPFFHVPPPHLGIDGLALGNRHHTFSGVRIGMEGFGVPTGRNVVFNTPFSTFGLSDQVAILPTYQNVVHTAVKFAGIKPSGRNDCPNGNSHGAPLSAYRLNPADNSVVGSWEIADASVSNAYVPFHHFAMPCGLPVNDSRVRVYSPGRTITHQTISIGNCHDAGDSVVLCLQQDATPTAVWVTTNWNSAYFNSTVPTTPSASATTIIYTPFASYAAFIASTARGYFHDAGNSCTWVRHLGGVGTPSSWTGGAEATVYKYNYLVIKST